MLQAMEVAAFLFSSLSLSSYAFPPAASIADGLPIAREVEKGGSRREANRYPIFGKRNPALEAKANVCKEGGVVLIVRK